MNAQTNEAQWYIARDGKQHGPLTDVEMKTFVGHNYLRPTDLIWKPGMADWLPAPQVFAGLFQQQTPAAPQTPAPQPVQPAMAAAQPQLTQHAPAAATSHQSDKPRDQFDDTGPGRGLFRQTGAGSRGNRVESSQRAKPFRLDLPPLPVTMRSRNLA